MAATSFTPISLYYSSTASNVPTAGNLVAGELAINTADGKLFYKDSAGVVQVIGTKGGVGSSTTTQVLYNNAGTIAGSANFVFDGTNVGIGTSSPSYKLDVKGSTGDIVRVSDGTNADLLLGTNSTGPYVFTPTAAALRFGTSNNERMRIDSAGVIGINVTPNAWYSSWKGIQGNSLPVSGNTEVHISSSAYFNAGASWVYSSSSYAPSYYQVFNGSHKWFNAPLGTSGNTITFNQAMTLDTSGNLLVGTTSQIGSGAFSLKTSGSVNFGVVVQDSADASGFKYFRTYNGSNTEIGSIARVTTTNAIVYNTTSDQRLKSNIVDSEPVLDKLLTVKVRQFDWTEGDLHQDAGFIAQELAPILSGIVTEGKTEEDMWQLDYSRLTPYLVKAIQELNAKVDALEAQLAAKG